MLEIYLICLVIGSILIGFTLFGGHHDMGGGHSPDIHLLHDDVHLPAHDSSQFGFSEVAQWFSLRNIIFFAAFFGLTGATLTWLGFSSVLTLSMAIILGLFSAALMYNSMKYLTKSQSGAELHTHSLKGCRGRVLVDISRGQKGKISVDVNGRILQLPARVSEIAEREDFHYGENVLIVEMEDGTAHIIESDPT
jgi:membrane protein implicated in regulation of membrane protease activity